MTNIQANLKGLDPVWEISTAAGSVAGNLVEYAGGGKVLEGVQKVANLASLPQFASQALEFKSDPSILNGLSLVGAGCDGLSALHDIDVIDLGSIAPAVGACSSLVTIATGGHDCATQVVKGREYHQRAQVAILPKIKGYFNDKRNICILNLVKKIVSISLAILSLLSLLFGSLPFFGVLLITGSVVYLTLTLGEHFYSKSVKQGKLQLP